ncbi:hypothetical protein NIES4071_104960 (plasmid) [Calothrix sp. NIES-4071]|nr:hypothetical protein NIES4071_104960 [Calothrix sp. NIES-4071]BAZ64914.1 hypothetical protein NIES4105_106470 [Calothrix sp. NIES-4105]
MQRLFMTVAGAVLMALGSGTYAPVQAALLDFNFTSVSGVTGSFTLDTDTKFSPQPSAGAGPGLPGILYPNAVSNFFLSSPQLNLNGVTADYEVVPPATSDRLGLPPGLGVLSGAVYPSGCSAQNFGCLVTAGVLYAGNLSQLPVLSDNPVDYKSLGIEFFDPQTGEQINLTPDLYTNFQVVRRQSIPEESSSLSLLIFGVVSTCLLSKRIQKSVTL